MPNNIYPNYVFDDKLISPINGYSCKRIFKLNIHKFGFSSIDQLLNDYPDFPLVCEDSRSTYISSAKNFVQDRTNKELNEYLDSPKYCPNCNDVIPFEKRNNKYCSQSCSTTYANLKRGPKSEKEKQNISAGVRKYTISNPRTKKEKITQKRYKRCVVCDTEFELSGRSNRTTCGKDCFITNQGRNATKQKSHGGGKKGIYKDFHCDSTYELAFLIYHLDHGIPFARCEETRTYVYNGLTKLYTPDFVVNDDIVEVKGFMSKQAEAKLTQNSDIKVIDRIGIKPYIKYVQKTYNVSKIESLYDISMYKHLVMECKYCHDTISTRNPKQVYCSRRCAGKSIQIQNLQKRK